MDAEDAESELTPDEAGQLVQARNRRAHLALLRTHPEEWWKRGMRDPASVQAIVSERLERHPDTSATSDPTYADFLAPTPESRRRAANRVRDEDII
jgi:hypothetical protein